MVHFLLELRRKGITKLESYFENCVVPPNLCTECDTQAIEPNLADAATSFTVKTLSAPGSCVETEITCKREDDKTCADVKIEAITPGGQSVITDSATDSSATSTITCAKDGTYSWRGITTGITKLECIFENCEPPPDPCTTCDIQTIAPILTDPDTSYKFTPLNAPGECLLNQMTCKRNDDKICGSVKIVAIRPGGSNVITELATPNSATTTIKCISDGTQAWEFVYDISKLECIFEDCASPCESCIQSNIEPDVTTMPLLMAYEFVQTNLPGTCITATVQCFKVDGVSCPLVGIGMEGFGILRGDPYVSSVSMSIQCLNDGTWRYGSITLSRLTCHCQ
ncbi:unnamed protein product [Caenorhabditis nigoni]